MEPQQLAPFIDQSALRPDMQRAELRRVCEEAMTFGFRGVVVSSASVGPVARMLGESSLKTIATVGFPHGNCSPELKVTEAQRAIAAGADEIDYVITIAAALEGDYRFIREEALAIARVSRGRLVKAILEVGYLSDEQKYECATAVAEGGCAYVKTCTGFGPGSASEEDVRLLARALEGKALVKASGGILERFQAVRLLSSGAAILGTSAGPAICSAD